MRYGTRMVFLITLLVAGQAVAQPKKPGLDADREKINFLTGSFVTETNMPASRAMPKGVTGKGTSIMSWALDSMFIQIEEQSVNPVFGHYQGHGMLGYDAINHEYVLSMFNNFADRPSYKGNFVGDTLVLATKVAMPGRSFDQKLVWYKDGPSVKLKVMNDSGKGFVLALEETSTPATQTTK